jgi:glyoxylase-like metal-dependent hydrolase (beta-lactamase superfamily II)
MTFIQTRVPYPQGHPCTAVRKVTLLDNGWLECDANMMVAGTVTGTRDQPTPPARWIKIPVYAVLIETSAGKILFDTGCHPDAMRGYWPEGLTSVFPHYCREEQKLENQLALAGTAPEEIQTVILSHLHLDHAGNLHLFKHADVFVHQRDFEYGLTMVHTSPDASQHGAYIKADLETPVKKFHLVDEDFILADGIEVITLPGHTPGVLGLVVELKQDGALIFPMDAVYTQANYGPPVKPPAIIYDSIAYARSIEKIRKLERSRNATVVFSHDYDFFTTLRKAPQYYQ